MTTRWLEEIESGLCLAWHGIVMHADACLEEGGEAQRQEFVDKIFSLSLDSTIIEGFLITCNLLMKKQDLTDENDDHILVGLKKALDRAISVFDLPRRPTTTIPNELLPELAPFQKKD